MKSVARVAIAGLMLLGLLSAAAMPRDAKHSTTVMVAGGGPMPVCDPNVEQCAPPIPPGVK